MAPPKVSSLEQPTPSMETEKTREHSLQNLNENSVTRTVPIFSGQIMDEELDKGNLMLLNGILAILNILVT